MRQHSGTSLSCFGPQTTHGSCSCYRDRRVLFSGARQRFGERRVVCFAFSVLVVVVVAVLLLVACWDPPGLVEPNHVANALDGYYYFVSIPSRT